jgi:hypothetical protein
MTCSKNRASIGRQKNIPKVVVAARVWPSDQSLTELRKLSKQYQSNINRCLKQIRDKIVFFATKFAPKNGN